MSTNPNAKVWLITGVSRGLGLSLARAVLEQGDYVIGTSRSGKAPLEVSERLTLLALEITDSAQIERAAAAAIAVHGRLDVLVNNAGYGLMGSIEEATDAEARHVFEVNFFGPLQLLQAVLPTLRAQRSGHIVNLSSIAGLAPRAGFGIYAAAKSALDGLSISLSHELAPLGISVTVVAPGGFRTEFLSDDSIRKSEAKIDDYAPSVGAVLSHVAAGNGKQPGDPQLAAKAIITAVGDEKPPLNLLLGPDAQQRLGQRQAQLNQDLGRWRELGAGTDYQTR